MGGQAHTAAQRFCEGLMAPLLSHLCPTFLCQNTVPVGLLKGTGCILVHLDLPDGFGSLSVIQACHEFSIQLQLPVLEAHGDPVCE